MSLNYLTGNTNSPIPIPDGYPKNIVSGKGAYVTDDNGNRFIDMWMGYGALFFGHSDPDIIKTIREGVKNGWFFSYPTKIEKEFSTILNKIIPSAESVRFSTTGSDAVAYAIRVSRVYTSRKKVLSIIGGYHGVHEGMIESAGTQDLIKPDLISFNDIEKARQALKTKKYACMLLEPILANSGCTPPLENYLPVLRKICDETKTVLVFDEIVTGFRVSLGGAQKKYKVTPDISLFSKAISSGLPLSVICGKKAIMQNFIPSGNVFFAGTFNGHPLSLAVAKEVINKLQDGKIYSQMDALGERFRTLVSQQIKKNNLNACVQGVGSMLTIAFGCKNFRTGIRNEKYNSKLYNIFIKKMARRNILFPPLPTETIFLSPVHESVIDEIERAFKLTLLEMSKL